MKPCFIKLRNGDLEAGILAAERGGPVLWLIASCPLIKIDGTAGAYPSTLTPRPRISSGPDTASALLHAAPESLLLRGFRVQPLCLWSCCLSYRGMSSWRPPPSAVLSRPTSNQKFRGYLEDFSAATASLCERDGPEYHAARQNQ